MPNETRTIRKRPVLGTTEKRIFPISFARYTAELGTISSVVSQTLYDTTAGEDAPAAGLTGSYSLVEPVVHSKMMDGTALTANHEYYILTTVAYADGQQRSSKLYIKVEV